MISITESIAADVKQSGSVAVGVRHLHGLVKTLDNAPLSMKALDNHWIQILSGTSEFKLMGTDESDFPQLPEPKSGRKAAVFAEVPAHALVDLLQKTQFSVSTDEARINLNGVLLEANGEIATMVSTDGHRLTKYGVPLHGLTLDKGIVIPRKGMLELRKLLDRLDGNVGICVAEGFLFAKAEQQLMSIKLNNVTFPPYKAVIPSAHTRFVEIPRGELLAALRRAEVMAPEKTATVRLSLQPGALELTADNPDLGIARQQLEVDYDDEALVAGFNARYLIEAVEVIDSENIRLEFQGQLDPCVIKPSSKQDFLAVVMPMRI
jgi:DNA polymerase-3 subunit beta